MKLKFLFLLLAFSTYEGSRDKTDWEKLNLKGKVKSTYEYTEYAMKDSQGQLHPHSYTTLFNERGYITKKTMYYDKSDTVVTIEKSGFNEHDNKTSFIARYANGEVIDSIITAYHYDEFSRVTRKTVVASNIVGKSDEEYKYDTFGRMSESDEFMPDGSMNMKCIYSYFNHQRTQDCYNKNNIIISRTIYLNDSSDKEVEFDYFSTDGKFLQHEIGSYDNRGNLMEWDKYEKDDTTMQTMVYDTYNNLISRITTPFTNKKSPFFMKSLSMITILWVTGLE